jgi:uncharacterized protein
LTAEATDVPTSGAGDVFAALACLERDLDALASVDPRGLTGTTAMDAAARLAAAVARATGVRLGPNCATPRGLSRCGPLSEPPSSCCARTVDCGVDNAGLDNGGMTRSLEVTWRLDGITMNGTLALPDRGGPFPAVVLVAGSGPTDRDWCSPLLPGANGSGRLLAEAFADAGMSSLRYDKRVSGPHASESARALFGKLSMRSHLEELTAAVSMLAGHEAVDAARIAALGNSEGALHVLHYVTSQPDVPFAGAVLAAPPGRSVGDVLLAQLALQAAQVPGGTELMGAVDAAVARYAAGQPMDLDPELPDSVKMVLTSFEAPANLPLARELFADNAAKYLGEVEIPVLVLIGRKDVQIDVTADGAPLEAAAQGNDNVTFAYPANANHVLKEDIRTPAETAAAPGTGYNEDNTRLDPEALRTILGWLGRVLG